MQRTLVFITLFAAAVVLATAASAWLTWRGVAGELRAEFEQRIGRIAATAANEIGPGEVAEARLREESSAYLSLQIQLVTLRTSTGLANASLIDTAGVTVVDARDPDIAEGLPSALDSLAGRMLVRALRGRGGVSPVYVENGDELRAGFAPIRDDAGRIEGVVAVEAAPAYARVVSQFGRTLLLIELVTALAIVVLAAFVVRGAAAGARLERRLSRVENLAAMGRLTATLAHEIKNPLAIIRGSAQRLGRLEPEARRMADFVVEEADRLSRTVARYLEFARGNAAPDGAGGDAAAALDATLDLMEGELAVRHVALARAGGFGAAPVALDNESLKQLYLNLILNALDAMPRGGTLTVSAVERAGRFEIGIADDGQGIPAETLRRLGSPFVTTKATGSGLGLFLARRLAESAGGELKIQSEAGRGTTCLLRLPRRRT
ncbi:MAG TPA: ATP-binding protein [Terriglobales bacterium]|nr:ATP-binding protein [Terriglobales bacterium]